MLDLVYNLHFWMMIAFFIMLLLFYKRAYLALSTMLYSKINHIAQEIENSKNLLNEATDLLINKVIEFENIKSKTDEILHRAQNSADILFDKTLIKIQHQIKHAKKSLTSYLETQNLLAQFTLNQKLLDDCVSSVKHIVATEIDDTQHSLIIDKSIDNIFTSINKVN